MNWDKALIHEAKLLFPQVFVEPDRVRIYESEWEYEEAETARSNEELKRLIDTYTRDVEQEYIEMFGQIDDDFEVYLYS